MNLAVEFKGLCKSFHGVHANTDISFYVKKGSIHAIIGENGAGKSTAMKMLYGTYQPDKGDIFLDGQLWGGRSKPWSSPSDAIRCGIGMVHQHFMLGEPHTVLDNILLGVESDSERWKFIPAFIRPIDKTAARKKLERLFSEYGLSVDLDARVRDLSVGIQQKIEIIKLLYREANILVLDEPTAVLTPQETADLFVHLKKLSQSGKTILIITHKLKEVMALADRVTVFRGGRVVGHRDVKQTNVEDLAELMVGRKVNLRVEVPKLPVLKKPMLELDHVTLGGGRTQLKDLNITVRGGEVVGISGVEGNGQSELLQLILHPHDYAAKMTGSIRLKGQDAKHFKANQVKLSGVGFLPEDRHRDALLLDRPVIENFLLGLHRRPPFYNRGLISQKHLEQAANLALEEYDIRPRSLQVKSSALSGGNQQKVVIAREFKYSPEFLVAAQPTRGVDVGAIEFIHKKILAARDQGSGVLLVSSELDEILALSDRILVMYEGRIVAEFNRGEVNERVLGLRMGGAVAAGAAV